MRSLSDYFYLRLRHCSAQEIHFESYQFLFGDENYQVICYLVKSIPMYGVAYRFFESNLSSLFGRLLSADKGGFLSLFLL